MVVWLRCLQNRIVQGLSLADGSSEFEQRYVQRPQSPHVFFRSTHVREKNISIQREIADIKAQVDECRSTLAEMQQKFDSLEGECFSIESELQIVQENFDTTQQEEKEQREVISGILLLCKGMSDSFSHESSHDSILSHHLSQKVGLLSELERCNESTLATSRYREREKIKICSGIQEGLEIGRQYKELLLGLSHEARILAEERRAGEICLEECRQRLEYSRQRVEGRVLAIFFLINPLRLHQTIKNYQT